MQTLEASIFYSMDTACMCCSILYCAVTYHKQTTALSDAKHHYRRDGCRPVVSVLRLRHSRIQCCSVVMPDRLEPSRSLPAIASSCMAALSDACRRRISRKEQFDSDCSFCHAFTAVPGTQQLTTIPLNHTLIQIPVSYTHLTLPTKRIV